MTLDQMIAHSGPMKSSPLRAIQSVFQSANWMTNLVWLSLAVLLNGVFIGQICLLGYAAELLEKRAGRPGVPTHDIDSNRLGDYIAKGIWPFLVYFLVQFGLGLIVAIPAAILAAAVMFSGSALGGDTGAALSLFIFVPLVLILSLLAVVFTVPFLINALVCQDFQRAFDINWALGFVRIMFWEIVISGLVFYLLSLAIVLIGFALLCVGYIPAMGIVAGGAVHLLAQWYEVYLDRGGLPASPPPQTIIDAQLVS